MRSLRHWINAGASGYRGPVTGAIETADRIVIIDLTDNFGARRILDTIRPGDVVGTYTQSRVGLWTGQAIVPGLMMPYNVYTGECRTLDEAREALATLVAEAEMLYAEQTANPEAELAALRKVSEADAYQHMSDDHTVWSFGEAVAQRISELEKA